MKELIKHICYTEYLFEEIGEEDRALLAAADLVGRGAYAPYSHFYVGAAVRLVDGTVVVGSNQENAAFPSGMCAERAALFAAGANYSQLSVEAIAVVARELSGVTAAPIVPCGGCLQTILEVERRFNRPIRILLGGEHRVLCFDSVGSLLPFGFTDFRQ